MTILKELSSVQLNRIPELRDKWIRIGLSTEPANREVAEEGLILAYTAAGMPPPAKIIWTGSPMGNALARDVSLSSKKFEVGASALAGVREDVWESVWKGVEKSGSVNIWKDVWKGVWESVWYSVEGAIGKSIRDGARESVGGSVYASGYGQGNAHWLGFYDALAEFGLKEQTEKLRGLWLVAQSAGWFLPHKNICWISERPTEIRLERVVGTSEFRNQLHCDSGPSIRFPDRWEIYALHGVRMSRDEHELDDPEKIVRVGNARIRVALMRRIGMERILARLPHKSLEQSGDYELLSIDFPGGQIDARYLRMKNPSVPGVWHLEGVHPTCRSIQEALNWRATGDKAQDWKPEVLT